MKIILFILLIAFSIVWAVFKKEEDVEGEEIDPSIFKRFLDVLGFCLMVFASGWFVFKEDLFLWLCFYTGILVILLLGLAEKVKSVKRWLSAFVILILVFCMFRTPTHPDSFRNWVSENKQLYCQNAIHCVKVSTYEDENNLLKTKAEVVPILDKNLNWYLLFATGYIVYEDSDGKEVKHKGMNVAGWWIETNE